MYKNDNMADSGKCAQAILEGIIGGNGNYPACDISPRLSNDSQGGCSMYSDSQWGLQKYPLAMVYAPLQEFENIYEPEAALENGTLFLELNLPFEGRQIKKGGCNRA